MSLALLFPGQGSQSVGMARALAESYEEARRTLEEADDLLGFSLSSVMFEGPEEELTATKNAQPAILAHSVAVLRVLGERIGEPALAAGHSLGEALARVTAGVCVPANFNSDGQIVISGDVAGVEQGMELVKEAGAKRVVPLNVSGAFHSPLMEPAADGLRAKLESMEFSDPTFPVVSNVTALPVTRGDEARDLLVAQLTSPVRWAASVAAMTDAGVDRFLELGPGSVLCGLNRRNARGVPCASAGEPDDLDSLGG